MVPPINISAGDYRAEIRTNGGGLSELKFQGRNLIEPYDETDTNERYRGDLLAPWPNRIRDGRYSVDDREFQLPINEIDRNNALHGLVNRLQWKVIESSTSKAILESTLPSSSCYPTTLQMWVSYELDQNGLTWKLSAKNVGVTKVPYGASIHPYLIAQPDQQVDDWALRLPADEVLDIDPYRLLPLNLVSVARKDFDFRNGAAIDQRFIDHAFKVKSSTLDRSVDVIAKNGRGVRMEFDSSSSWIQIHTADRSGAKNGRMCLAVEPMSCPPDAFNSGIDLIWLQPGAEHTMTWKICAI
ncbi:MAG TPA: aldose 1-epimerase family protein [Candidatus Nanopelagicaceae bacterium]